MKEIVIKLPDDYNVNMGAEILIDAVIDGVELPKGHGRLIDASEFAKSVCTWLKPTVPDETMLVDIAEVGVGVIDEIEEQPTVIEADKEG